MFDAKHLRTILKFNLTKSMVLTLLLHSILVTSKIQHRVCRFLHFWCIFGILRYSLGAFYI